MKFLKNANGSSRRLSDSNLLLVITIAIFVVMYICAVAFIGSGFTKVQTFFKIIFPQVMKRILPSITNETITLVKDTSLAFVLSQAEMFTLAKQIAAAETSIMPLMAAGLFYYIFNLLVAAIMERIEKSMDYYH